MDEEERWKLLEKLQQEEEDFLASLTPSKYQDGWKEETWEKEMDQHPLFAKKLPDGEELPPLVEALQQLKYDTELNGPEDLAEQYKTDGNHNFKLKKYRWAVISYTEGLRQKCKNLELNAQLYCNRAAAQFRLKNYGSALADSTAASKLKPNYTKAMTKAALCCWELEHYKECIDWCKQLLQVDPANAEMKVLEEKAEKALKLEERNRRKEELKAKNTALREAALRSALLERGIELPKAKDEELECSPFEALTPTHPALRDYRVHLSPTGDGLVWPAVFLYPEVMEADFVQQFDESSTFGEQLELLFGDTASQPEWNASGRYTSNNVSVGHMFYSSSDLHDLKYFLSPVSMSMLMLPPHQQACYQSHCRDVGAPHDIRGNCICESANTEGGAHPRTVTAGMGTTLHMGTTLQLLCASRVTAMMWLPPAASMVWFKDHFTGKPVAITPETTLRTVVYDKRFHIDNGTTSFWILPKGTEYEAHFLAKAGCT